MRIILITIPESLSNSPSRQYEACGEGEPIQNDFSKNVKTEKEFLFEHMTVSKFRSVLLKRRLRSSHVGPEPIITAFFTD